MKRLLLVLPLLMLLGPPEGGPYIGTLEAAPAFSASALTQYLQDVTARGAVPGVVVAVVDKGGLVYHEAFGKMNATKNVPMAKDTIFNIASMTKPVTSVAIMMLVDEGKLKLDDDVAKYLPKYKDPQVIVNFNAADASYQTRPAKRPITVRHLLTHTSGIGYGFASPVIAAIQQQAQRAKRPPVSELDVPLLFDPGESWAYGASTRVLGTLVETISGQKLDAFLESRLLRPLGMHDTSYVVAAEKVGRVVTSSTRTNGKLVEGPAPTAPRSNVQGDGGLFSTAGDYAQFVKMLLNDGRAASAEASAPKGGSTRILSAKSARTMFDNHSGRVVLPLQTSTNQGLSRDFPLGAGEDTWGLGFQLARPKVKKAGTRAPGSGTWAGIFNTHFWVDRDKEVGVIVMMQLLPFYDEEAMKVLAGVEEIVYRK